MPRWFNHNCPACGQNLDILEHERYGGHDVNRPEFGTIGRWSPDMVSLLPDHRTFEIKMRYDRPAYLLYRQAGASHEDAIHNSILCGSWSAKYNIHERGVWEFAMQAPDDNLVELVAMIWPQDNSVWPDGEINIVEGRVGNPTMLCNLHWKSPQGTAEHDPYDYAVDTTKSHIYRCEVEDRAIRWFVDGALIRELESPHISSDLPAHLVIQCGVNKDFHKIWNESLEWERVILFRPIRVPGLPPLY